PRSCISTAQENLAAPPIRLCWYLEALETNQRPPLDCWLALLWRPTSGWLEPEIQRHHIPRQVWSGLAVDWLALGLGLVGHRPSHERDPGDGMEKGTFEVEGLGRLWPNLRSCDRGFRCLEHAIASMG